MIFYQLMLNSLQLKKATEKYSIAPQNTYNLDKKGYQLGVGRAPKRITRNVRTLSVYKKQRVPESCTVVEAVVADGFFLTPLIIFCGENQLAGWYKSKKEMEFQYSHVTKDFNNNKICLQYMEKIFEPETKNR